MRLALAFQLSDLTLLRSPNFIDHPLVDTSSFKSSILHFSCLTLTIFRSLLHLSLLRSYIINSKFKSAFQLSDFNIVQVSTSFIPLCTSLVYQAIEAKLTFQILIRISAVWLTHHSKVFLCRWPFTVTWYLLKITFHLTWLAILRNHLHIAIEI